MSSSILIGYFPKRKMLRPVWLKNPQIEQICSASDCISEGPIDWIDQWRHNDMWAYDTAELAWSVVPEAERKDFEIHAYRMFPVIFEAGAEKPFELPLLQVKPLPDTFELLGFDAVSRTMGNIFEHSPLSCNHMADEIAVNRYCLVDNEQAAFQMAQRFEAGEGEPGLYYVVEVWRERRAG